MYIVYSRCLTVVVTTEISGASRLLANNSVRVLHWHEGPKAFVARTDLDSCYIAMSSRIDKNISTWAKRSNKQAV